MATPIRAFVGLNGHGKTLAMTEMCALPALKAGRPVWANYRVHHDDAHLLRTFRFVDELEACTLLLDEITSVFPSRQAMSLPPQFARVLQQLRKRDVDVAWTAPSWQRADRLLREVTAEVWLCRGYMPKTDEGSTWPSNRLFRFKRYSAEDYEEFTLDKARKLRATGNRWYWRTRHEAHTMYDTNEGVALLDHLDDVGICVSCGGSRSRPKCRCTTERPDAGGRRVSADPAAAATPSHDTFA